MKYFGHSEFILREECPYEDIRIDVPALNQRLHIWQNFLNPSTIDSKHLYVVFKVKAVLQCVGVCHHFTRFCPSFIDGNEKMTN